MVPAQRLGGDGNVLVVAVAGARGLREVEAAAGPQHVFLATHHAHDLRLQVFVAIKRHAGGKLLIGATSREVILAAKPRERSLLHQAHKLLLLHSIGMVDVAGMVLQSGEQPRSCYGCKIYQFFMLTWKFSSKIQIILEIKQILPFLFRKKATHMGAPSGYCVIILRSFSENNLVIRRNTHHC